MLIIYKSSLAVLIIFVSPFWGETESFIIVITVSQWKILRTNLEKVFDQFFTFFFTIATAFKMSAPGNNQCNYKSYQTAKLQNKSIFNFILFKNRPKSISYEIKILEPGPRKWCAGSINKILLPSYYLRNVRRMFAMISRNICIRPSVTPTIFREAKFQLFKWKNPAKHSGCLL